MKNLALLSLLCFSQLVSAQKYYDDAQVRGHFNIETKLNKRFTVHLDQQYRITNNVSDFSRGSADIGITFKINKHIKLLADYVYIQKQKNSGIWNQRNWYYGAVVLKKDIGYWRIVGRAMLQARNGDVNSDKANLTRLYNRNKVSVRYEINKRLTGFVAEEIYIPLNSPQAKGIDRSRTFAGILINTFKNQQLEFYFMYQVWTQKNNWWDQSDRYPDPLLRRDFIYGIGYGIEF